MLVEVSVEDFVRAKSGLEGREDGGGVHCNVRVAEFCQHWIEDFKSIGGILL